MNLKIAIILFASVYSLRSSAQLRVEIKNGNFNRCASDTVLLESTIITGSPSSYLWSSANGKIFNSNLPKTKALFTESQTIYLKTGDGTYTWLDSVQVTVDTLPAIGMPGDVEVCCDGGSINLDSLGQSPKGGNWSCVKNPYYVTGNSIFETAIACHASTSIHFITYTYTHPSTGCANKDSFKIKVNPLPNVKLQDGYFCQGKGIVHLKNDKVILLPGNLSILGRQEWKCIDCNTYDWSQILEDLGSGLPGAPQEFILNIDQDAIPLGTKTSDSIVIELIYRSVFGCYNRDTATVHITGVPKISFDGFPELCWDQDVVSLIKLSKVTPNDGYWQAYDTLSSTYRSAVDLNGAIKNGDSLNTLNTPKPTYPSSFSY